MFIMTESCSHMKNEEVTEHTRVRSEQPEALPPEAELGIPRLCGSSQVVLLGETRQDSFPPLSFFGKLET